MITINVLEFLDNNHREPYINEIHDWEFIDLIDGTWESVFYNMKYIEACNKAKKEYGKIKGTDFGEIYLVGYLPKDKN